MCYYFDHIVKTEDFNLIAFYGIKNHENILIYEISYKNLIGAKPLCIIYNKVDAFIRDYNGTEYLLIFGSKKMMLFSIWLDM